MADYSQFIKNPLVIALDVDTRDRALALVDELAEIAGAFKVGPRLNLRYGNSLVEEISKRTPVFVDNKHFDIPSTMKAAVQSSFDAGATLVTVHAQAGREALEEISHLEKKLNEIRPFKILAVTILTSFTTETLPSILKSQSIETHVQALAELVQNSGLDGLVCSPQELTTLKNKNLFLVTPGIRFVEDGVQDQKRIMGPSEAMRAGASAVVVGRPIIEAKNSKEAALDYITALYI